MFPQVDISKTLRRIPWFVDLTSAQIERLASISSQTDLEPGQFLFKEGDREDVLYVILAMRNLPAAVQNERRIWDAVIAKTI